MKYTKAVLSDIIFHDMNNSRDITDAYIRRLIFAHRRCCLRFIDILLVLATLHLYINKKRQKSNAIYYKHPLYLFKPAYFSASGKR